MRFILVIYSYEMIFLYSYDDRIFFLQNVNIFGNVHICSVIKD